MGDVSSISSMKTFSVVECPSRRPWSWPSWSSSFSSSWSSWSSPSSCPSSSCPSSPWSWPSWSSSSWSSSCSGSGVGSSPLRSITPPCERCIGQSSVPISAPEVLHASSTSSDARSATCPNVPSDALRTPWPSFSPFLSLCIVKTIRSAAYLPPTLDSVSVCVPAPISNAPAHSNSPSACPWPSWPSISSPWSCPSWSSWSAPATRTTSRSARAMRITLCILRIER
mmetsp:Transcript_14859/g.37232  ORF Transcript_14859/g.37232 Transcript_14859/m.37232 type:complete len:226 (-) Transcript_14859:37-714(-)